MRPAADYACPVWHSSLAAAETTALESLQWRAMRTVFPDDDYSSSLAIAGVETLASRRQQLTQRFYMCSVVWTSSCLHYRLPDKRDPAITDWLLHPKTFNSSLTRTEKFCKSFLPYCLNHYDWLLTLLDNFVIFCIVGYCINPPYRLQHEINHYYYIIITCSSLQRDNIPTPRECHLCRVAGNTVWSHVACAFP